MPGDRYPSVYRRFEPTPPTPILQFVPTRVRRPEMFEIPWRPGTAARLTTAAPRRRRIASVTRACVRIAFENDNKKKNTPKELRLETGERVNEKRAAPRRYLSVRFGGRYGRTDAIEIAKKTVAGPGTRRPLRVSGTGRLKNALLEVCPLPSTRRRTCRGPFSRHAADGHCDGLSDSVCASHAVAAQRVCFWQRAFSPGHDGVTRPARHPNVSFSQTFPARHTPDAFDARLGIPPSVYRPEQILH